MPSFRTTRRVRHTPEEMFALVADIERYPEFVPLCESLSIRRRTEQDDGHTQILADMAVGYRAIRETFTSRVTLDEAHLKIMVEYVDGPFRHLENRWSFKPDEQGCLVEFFITYEFRNIALSLLMGAMFERAFRKFAEAFEERARRIYGLRPSET